MRRFALVFCLMVISGCASPRPVRPPNVTVGLDTALPAPRSAPSDALPRIIAANFSTLNIKHPEVWSGTIVTTTNVASLELRTNQFAISVPRTAFGRFAFTLRVYDVPDEFLRSYALRIIARNSAGAQAEEDVPLRIR